MMAMWTIAFRAIATSSGATLRRGASSSWQRCQHALAGSTPEGWQLSPGWHAALADEVEKPYFTELQSFVEGERASGHVLPSRSDQLAAFSACDFNRVRCVILGQVPITRALSRTTALPTNCITCIMRALSLHHCSPD